MNIKRILFLVLSIVWVNSFNAYATHVDQFCIKVEKEDSGCKVRISDHDDKTLFKTSFSSETKRIDVLQQVNSSPQSTAFQSLKQLTISLEGTVTLETAADSNVPQRAFNINTFGDVISEGLYSQLDVFAKTFQTLGDTQILKTSNFMVENILHKMGWLKLGNGNYQVKDTVEIAKGAVFQANEDVLFQCNYWNNDGKFYSIHQTTADINSNIKFGYVRVANLLTLNIGENVDIQKLAAEFSWAGDDLVDLVISGPKVTPDLRALFTHRDHSSLPGKYVFQKEESFKSSFGVSLRTVDVLEIDIDNLTDKTIKFSDLKWNKKK